jgi:hypothetical protein
MKIWRRQVWVCDSYGVLPVSRAGVEPQDHPVYDHLVMYPDGEGGEFSGDDIAELGNMFEGGHMVEYELSKDNWEYIVPATAANVGMLQFLDLRVVDHRLSLYPSDVPIVAEIKKGYP